MRTQHEPTTRGGQALQAWLKSERRSQAWLADQLRREGDQLHQTTVSTWIGGKAPPTLFAVRLEEMTGIPVRSWIEPARSTADESGPQPAVDAAKTG